MHVLKLCFNHEFHESAPSVINALDHLLLVSSPQFQTPPRLRAETSAAEEATANYRSRTSHQSSRTRPPRCVVVAPSSNGESGTVSLDYHLLGPSPMGKPQVKWPGRNSKEVLDPESRLCSMQVLYLAGLKKGEHKSQELKVNNGSPERMACPRRHVQRGGALIVRARLRWSSG